MIDATEYALPSVDEDIGFYKIAKYNYFPGWHQQASAFELLINKDAWSKLSPAQIKLASLWNTSAPIQGESLVHFVDRVAESSAGSIQIKIFNPGKLVASTEILDAVSAGKVDAGWSSPGFWMGKMPAAPLFSSVPFGPDSSEYLAWFFAGNGLKLFQEMYDRYGFNVKVFVSAISPPETSGWHQQTSTIAISLLGRDRLFILYHESEIAYDNQHQSSSVRRTHRKFHSQ